MDESSHGDGYGSGHIEAGREKATMLGMVMVLQLRRWLALHDDMDLTEADVAQVFAFTETMDDSLGIIDTLEGAARAMDPAPAALARLLTHRDPPGSRFELHEEHANGDLDCLALGMFIRLNVAAHGFEDAVERQAAALRLEGTDGTAYGREILQRVLTDIHDLTRMQRIMEDRHRG